MGLEKGQTAKVHLKMKTAPVPVVARCKPRPSEVVLLYDIRRGKSHHRHLRGKEEPYEFADEDKLLDDFLREVDLIVEGKL